MAIPGFAVGVVVTGFGAVVDGVTNNSQTFRDAIAACGKNKTVFIPSGTYLLKDALRISKSSISLSRDEKAPASLFFDKSIEDLFPLYD